ncbi:hypothetical protein [Acidithiobacillus sulfuriphilus]|uniref:Uncharacterized protein n=2 Tax=Acidithiobacillus sulfuriphilus TaxID=1867749 RepID=A0A3M8QPQ3_9PROT|nr:hypothetical protein [Acidithiobacillus sulfuriphilus]RNF58215.1 hypothetical protein EC580_12735 [Acidithiobacillus sulfuriphilus]
MAPLRRPSVAPYCRPVTIGKVGKSSVSAKPAGKSRFADLVNYVAREADGKGREVDRGEMGVLNMDAHAKSLGFTIKQMDRVIAKFAQPAQPTNHATFSAG